MLTGELQSEYSRRYGGPGDRAPIDTSQFDPPAGHFVLVYIDDVPAAMGGWRRHDELPATGDAEIKRMYVRPAYQRHGLARLILAELERTAAAAGVTRLVLETGQIQPEAIALYRSMGYGEVESFGYYAGLGSVHLGKMIEHRRVES